MELSQAEPVIDSETRFRKWNGPGVQDQNPNACNNSKTRTPERKCYAQQREPGAHEGS
jgi:hypothetical protein